MDKNALEDLVTFICAGRVCHLCFRSLTEAEVEIDGYQGPKKRKRDTALRQK